ncbi:MAG: response regulator [Acidobacteriota bacterium]
MAYKIVVADSSPAVQKVVQMAFPEPDFEVHFVEDGREVLAALGRINPECVLLSLSLPSADGYEVIRQIRSREEFQRTALVLLKSAFEPLDGERLKGLNYDEIISKPFDSEKLAALVRELVDRRKVPSSFPEESLLDEVSEAGVLPLFKEEEFIPRPHSSSSREDLEESVSSRLREEILSVERELEKRLRASLRAELKEWLEKEKKKLP